MSSFYFSSVSSGHTPSINTGLDRYVNVGNSGDSLNKFPAEVRNYVQLEQLEDVVEQLCSFANTTNQRLQMIEQFITTACSKLNQMEQTIEQMLTPRDDLALKLTDESENVRRLAQQIVDIKKAMGVVANGF